MRTKNKDIAMICKGFYVVTNEYRNPISALKDYIKEYTGNAELSSESLLHHLTKAVLEFIPKEEQTLPETEVLKLITTVTTTMQIQDPTLPSRMQRS